MNGLFGWQEGLQGWRFRVSWMVVLATGLTFSLLGYSPVPLILLAQGANGILLPIIAGFLVWAANDRQLLGKATNTLPQNLLSAAVLIITLLLSVRTFSRLFA